MKSLSGKPGVPGSPKKNHNESLPDLGRRINVMQGIVLAVFLILGVRFYHLQIAQHEKYVAQAENNRIREIPIIAARGSILDRNGKILVDNKPTFNIVVMPEDITNREETLTALAENLNVSRDEALRELINPNRPKTDPILIKQNVGAADRAWVAAHQEEHPEIIIDEQPQRVYPYGKTACHVIGYVGQISPKQLENPKYQEEGYKIGDIIGQGGIEAYYDKLLRGKNGVRRVIVDSRGRMVREFDRIPPIKGQDLVLSLDLDIQQVAEEQFEKNDDKGAAIAMDTRSGEIIAMVSYPGFDPNVFARNVISSEYRKEVVSILLDPGHPLNNKAIQGYYPAGSTWKIMMSTAAIESGVTPLNDSRITCGGGLQVGGRFVHCMGNHGAPDVHTAIVRSCDGYYYRLGVKLGLAKQKEWLARFGMGQKTGIDLPHERAGSVPSEAWKARANPRQPDWTDFDSALSAVGQGAVAIPPIQLIRAETGIMMNGIIHTPHFLKEARETEFMPVKYFEDTPVDLHLSPETSSTIRYAAWGVVNEGGTGGGIGFPRDLNVGGKTGTAQVISKDKAKGKHLQDHSWFISFAPINKDTLPEFAVVCFTENGGFGAKASGPKAKAIHIAYFAKKAGQPIPSETIAKGSKTPAQPAGTPKPAAQPRASADKPASNSIATLQNPRPPVDVDKKRNQ
jgi:penicillin-binding protein 2